jgi:hypothetical protein
MDQQRTLCRRLLSVFSICVFSLLMLMRWEVKQKNHFQRAVSREVLQHAEMRRNPSAKTEEAGVLYQHAVVQQSTILLQSAP